jgi:hypothetical protein
MGGNVQSFFEQGVLIRPSDARPNLVHLVRALAHLAGVADMPQSDPVRQISDLIGPGDHIISVLLDGLGMNILRQLPAEAVLSRHLRMELQATCPSTTACALTTVATADYPARHGVTGWFTHLPEHGLTAVSLPFVERMSNQPLVQRGLRPQDVYPLPPICPRMTHQPLTLCPAYIANTTYNRYSRGDTPAQGYNSIRQAVDLAIAHVAAATRPTYTHLYLHDVDTLCHHVGVEHPEVDALVLRIDTELSRLADAVHGRARIVITADHGLIEVPREEQTLLRVGDPLLDLLQVPPSGDARLPIFHVREGRRRAFADAFEERFHDGMVLLETDQAEQMELFGPGSIAPRIRPRFGDFVGIAFRPATVAYHPPDKPLGKLYLAVHAGLSPQEMRIPLCIL